MTIKAKNRGTKKSSTSSKKKEQEKSEEERFVVEILFEDGTWVHRDISSDFYKRNDKDLGEMVD